MTEMHSWQSANGAPTASLFHTCDHGASAFQLRHARLKLFDHEPQSRQFRIGIPVRGGWNGRLRYAPGRGSVEYRVCRR